MQLHSEATPVEPNRPRRNNNSPNPTFMQRKSKAAGGLLLICAKELVELLLARAEVSRHAIPPNLH